MLGFRGSVILFGTVDLISEALESISIVESNVRKEASTKAMSRPCLFNYGCGNLE